MKLTNPVKEDSKAQYTPSKPPSPLLSQLQQLDKELHDTKFELEKTNEDISTLTSSIKKEENKAEKSLIHYYSFWKTISDENEIPYKLVEDIMTNEGFSMFSLMYQSLIEIDNENLKSFNQTVTPTSKSTISTPKVSLNKNLAFDSGTETQVTQQVGSTLKSQNKSAIGANQEFVKSDSSLCMPKSNAFNSSKNFGSDQKVDIKTNNLSKFAVPIVPSFFKKVSQKNIESDQSNLYKNFNKKKTEPLIIERILDNDDDFSNYAVKSPTKNRTMVKLHNHDGREILKKIDLISSPEAKRLRRKSMQISKKSKIQTVICDKGIDKNRERKLLDKKLTDSKNEILKYKKYKSLYEIDKQNNQQSPKANINNADRKNTEDQYSSDLSIENKLEAPSESHFSLEVENFGPLSPANSETQKKKSETEVVLIKDSGCDSTKAKKDLKILQNSAKFIYETSRTHNNRRDSITIMPFHDSILHMVDPKMSNKLPKAAILKPKPIERIFMEDRKRMLQKIHGRRSIISDGTFNIRIEPFVYETKFEEQQLSGKPLTDSQYKSINGFFMKSAISDEQRKKLWRARIGNKLKITKEIFANLMIRVSQEEFPKKIAKLISDDMVRSFPAIHDKISDDSDTFQNLTALLKIFHIYRPDIGYTQGMAYHVSMLYTYFSEYETFKYFCNLLYTKEFIFNLYAFNTQKVLIFTQKTKNFRSKSIMQLLKKLLRQNALPYGNALRCLEQNHKLL